MEAAIEKLYNLAGIGIILMIPLLLIGAIVWRIQLRIEKHEEFYDAIKETVSTENQPNQNKLRALTKFRKFRKEIPEFQKAVREKLKTYDLVPTTIEKTMSSAQLYKANNPLWITGVNVKTIKSVFILENKLGKDVVAKKHIDEFM